MNDKIQLTAELIEGFAGSLLSPRFDIPAPTPPCHREWWELCCSSYKRVAIAAPRGHAKSTAITKAYTLAAVLFRTRDFVLVISDTYKQAVLFLGEIKNELASNEPLRELFGIEEFETDREDDIIIRLKDGYRFRIMALGSEQKVRGLLWTGKRPNLMVADDMENDEIVMNPDRREKFRNWINNALLPALSDDGIVRWVGTILHMDAALERNMPKDRSPNTIHTELKSYMAQPLDGWMSVRYKAHNEDMSKVLWPIKWSKARFKELQALFIAQGNPEGYYQEYLNRPIDPTNAFFKKDDFQEFDKGDTEKDWGYCPTYLSLDGAFSTKERRDWCAFGIGSLDEKGMLYLRHVIRERMDTKDVVETIARLQQVYKFNTLLIGKGAYEKGIGPFLSDEIRKRGKFLHIEAIPETIDKRLRAQSIRGRMRVGGCKFNKRAAWYPDLEQEMLEFDRGTHDDQVDMMSLFGMYLDKLMNAPTREEIKEFETFEDDHRLEKLDPNQGRNPMTGY